MQKIYFVSKNKKEVYNLIDQAEKEYIIYNLEEL